MRHPSGYVVYYEADTLLTAQPDERQRLLGAVVDGMLDKDVQAGNTAYWLGRDITGIDDGSITSHLSFDTPTAHGNFDSTLSLGLVRDTERLHGFLTALKRWPEQSAVIDVGCGPFPVLALAAALFHPKAEVTAVEINQRSAESAEEIIHQFGLSDRIKVVNDDIDNHPIDSNFSAAVTETFNSGLQEEPGPKIVKLLHENGVPTITPSAAKIRFDIAQTAFYQTIDLRVDTHAEIKFDGNDYDLKKHGYPDISAEYYDDYGVVLAYDKDVISSGLPLRRKMHLHDVLQQAGYSGELTYELGHYPFKPVVNQPVNSFA